MMGPHRSTTKPPSRGNAIVGATAALGAVVTGGLLAVEPSFSFAPMDAADTSSTDLASAAEPLVIQPATTRTSAPRASSSDYDSTSATTTLLPVAMPGERVAAADQRDVEMLHKAEKIASEASAAHAATTAAVSKEASVIRGGGSLDDWISVALIKMDMPESLAPGIKRVIMRESRGNPKAINRTDSNALAGRPSQGLMQTIPSTYRAYVLPELAHLPITNPVSNITAGVRYMVANYGLSTLKAGGRTNAAGQYIGY